MWYVEQSFETPQADFRYSIVSLLVVRMNKTFLYLVVSIRKSSQIFADSNGIAGDEQIKIWKPTTSSLILLRTLESTSDAVLTLAIKESTLFAGHQGGVIKVRDIRSASELFLMSWIRFGI